MDYWLADMFFSRKVRWFILIGLLAILYGHMLVGWAVDLWHDDNYSHGLFIPFLSGYFFWRRLSALRQAGDMPCTLGLPVMLAALMLFALGNIGGEIFSQRVSFVVLIYGLILFLEGREVAAILRFPVGILFFAIPLPYILYNAVAFPLKLVASQLSVLLLELYGMPVFREGNIVHLPHATLEVVDACSGIRSLMTLFTLAFFLAFLTHRNLFVRLFVVCMTIPVAILTNALRVALNGILIKYNPAWGEGLWHEISGWLVFVVSVGLLMAISSLFTLWKGGAAGKGAGNSNELSV